MTTDFKKLLITQVDEAAHYSLKVNGFLETHSAVAFADEHKLLDNQLKEGITLTVNYAGNSINVTVCAVQKGLWNDPQWYHYYSIRLNRNY